MWKKIANDKEERVKMMKKRGFDEQKMMNKSYGF